MTAIIPLGDAADFINGYAFAPEDWHGDGAPIIRIQNLTDDKKPFNRTKTKVPSRYHVSQGELLVSWSATLGVFEWTQSEIGLVNQHIFRVKPREHLTDKNYLRHAIVGALDDMRPHLHGATMQHVNRGEFLSTPVYFPPLPEQRRIAAILDQADALRAKRRAALAQLDEMGSAIFIEMFGDPRTNSKNWPVTQLSDLVMNGDSINYGVVQPGNSCEGGIPLVRVSDLKNGRVSREKIKFISPEIEKAYKRSRLHGDELLISCVGSIGVVALTSPKERGSNIARAVCRVRPNNEVKREFLAEYLRSNHIQSYFENELRTSSQPTLNIKQIAETSIQVPPLSLQQQFVERLEVEESIRVKMLASEQCFLDLFSSLQHRAFAGEL